MESSIYRISPFPVPYSRCKNKWHYSFIQKKRMKKNVEIMLIEEGTRLVIGCEVIHPH